MNKAIRVVKPTATKTGRKVGRPRKALPEGDSIGAPLSAVLASGDDGQRVRITAPNMITVQIAIIGTAPLMVQRFSEKSIAAMRAKQAAGSTARKGRAREAKDFDAAFHAARHLSTDGWDGVAASAFRNAMISACRLVGYKMTLAKLSIFVQADGVDKVDNMPLVRILGKPPIKTEMPVRNETGVMDIRARPVWNEWAMRVRIRFDADQFTSEDVTNLMARVGEQVGIGEGRPDSTKSTGIGYGLFRIATEKDRI